MPLKNSFLVLHISQCTILSHHINALDSTFPKKEVLAYFTVISSYFYFNTFIIRGLISANRGKTTKELLNPRLTSLSRRNAVVPTWYGVNLGLHMVVHYYFLISIWLIGRKEPLGYMRRQSWGPEIT